MDEELRSVKEHYQENYINDKITRRIKSKVYEQIENKRKWNLSKKLIYVLGTAVIIIGMFIGSAFVSPTMAQVVAKVPYLNHLLKSMDETEDRTDRLNEFFNALQNTLAENKKYKGKVGINMSYKCVTDPPVITVQWTNQTDEQLREIKQMIKETAQSYKIGDYQVKVEDPELIWGSFYKEEKKRMEDQEELAVIARKALEPKGYKLFQLGIEPETQTIMLKIEMGEEHFKQVKDEMSSLIHTAYYKKTKLDYKIDVQRQEKTIVEEKDRSWQSIFEAISNESHKEYKVVTGFSYKVHQKPEVLDIFINTDMSNNSKDKQLAREIEEYVQQIIAIKKEELPVKQVPYNIKIRDKNKDVLFEKMYE